jgi:hypothetical protein
MRPDILLARFLEVPGLLISMKQKSSLPARPRSMLHRNRTGLASLPPLDKQEMEDRLSVHPLLAHPNHLLSEVEVEAALLAQDRVQARSAVEQVQVGAEELSELLLLERNQQHPALLDRLLHLLLLLELHRPLLPHLVVVRPPLAVGPNRHSETQVSAQQALLQLSVLPHPPLHQQQDLPSDNQVSARNRLLLVHHQALPLLRSEHLPRPHSPLHSELVPRLQRSARLPSLRRLDSDHLRSVLRREVDPDRVDSVNLPLVNLPGRQLLVPLPLLQPSAEHQQLHPPSERRQHRQRLLHLAHRPSQLLRPLAQVPLLAPDSVNRLLVSRRLLRLVILPHLPPILSGQQRPPLLVDSAPSG